MNIGFSQGRTCLMVAVAALLAACAGAPKARVDRDANANFVNYRTFAWSEPKPADAAAQVEFDTLANRRAHAAVMAAFQDKGYVLDEAHPDVRIGYVINVYQRPKQSGFSIGVGAGGGSGNVAGGIGASIPIGKRNETVAAMTVDVFDVTRKAPVWHGASEIVLANDVATEAEVQSLTDSILSKYPSPGK